MDNFEYVCVALAFTQAGYSSVGRASDCRDLQQSDGPWFDSGWPDLFFFPPWARDSKQALAHFVGCTGDFETLAPVAGWAPSPSLPSPFPSPNCEVAACPRGGPKQLLCNLGKGRGRGGRGRGYHCHRMLSGWVLFFCNWMCLGC